jgi:two-component system, chemotaxis family, chemotaxis protein CheY
MNILVVDDVRSNRLLPVFILRKLGWTVTEAADGAEAITLLSEKDYDCVLLDISMPGISGEEVCRRIRGDAKLKALRLIAYTAHALTEEKERIREAGFDEVLIKPITRESLLTAIGH